MPLTNSERDEKIQETHDSVLRLESMMEHCGVKTHEGRISKLEWGWKALWSGLAVIGTVALAAFGMVAGWFKP